MVVEDEIKCVVTKLFDFGKPSDLPSLHHP